MIDEVKNEVKLSSPNQAIVNVVQSRVSLYGRPHRSFFVMIKWWDIRDLYPLLRRPGIYSTKHRYH